MRKVRALLKKDHHLDVVGLTGEEKGSIADFPAEDLQALIRLKLSDRDASWQKPGRNRAMYKDFKCPTPQTQCQKCWRRRKDMGLGAMREFKHLQALLRLGKLPPRRAVLERKASSDDSGFGLWWG